jgi:hypothetical protein
VTDGNADGEVTTRAWARPPLLLGFCAMLTVAGVVLLIHSLSVVGAGPTRGSANVSPVPNGASSADEGRSPMDVEVDLYSGRPNPRFTLGSGATAELTHRLETLPPAGESARPHEGLGYRGLHVQAGSTDSDTDADIVTDIVTEIVVSGGLVTVRNPDGSMRRLKDPERALERWLLDRGAADLDPNVVATIRQDLKR